jgi:hypothetical protein
MNSEERFKKSLDELLHAKEFSFDEDNWEKARDMIDASKKAKRRIAPLILAGTLLLFVSLLTGFYFLSDPKPGAEKLALSPGNKPADVSPLITGAEINSSNAAPKTKPGVHLKKPVATTPAKEQAFAKIPPAKGKTPADHAVPAPEKIMSSPVKVKAEYIKNEKENAQVTSPSVTPAVENILGSAPGIKSPEHEKNDPLIRSSAPVSPAIAESTGKGSEERPGKVGKDERVTSNEPFYPQRSSANEPLKTETPVTEIKTKEDVSAATVTAAPTRSESIVAAPAIVPVDSTKSHTGKEEPETVLTDNDQGEIGKPKELPVLFSIEAGASYLYGWQNPGTRDANGFNPLIGINYFNNFRPKMSLSFGLHYSSVGNLSYSNYTSRVTRRGLGEESQVTVFTPVKIHYLIVPIRFNYTINPMNTLGIGCNIAYLLTVESEVESYTQKLNTIDNYNLAKVNGYTQGFKKYDTQVSVFYKRRLYPNLAVNIEMFFGLTDVKDNHFFNSNVFERNSGLKLTLVYNILKK